MFTFRRQVVREQDRWGFIASGRRNRYNPDIEEEDDDDEEDDGQPHYPRRDLTQCLQETLIKSTSLLNVQPRKLTMWEKIRFKQMSNSSSKNK
jgi:hypothetical protein